MLHAKIPKSVIEVLNKYIDETIKYNEKQKKLDHGNYLVGDITQEFVLDKEVIQSSGWLKFLSKCTFR